MEEKEAGKEDKKQKCGTKCDFVRSSYEGWLIYFRHPVRCVLDEAKVEECPLTLSLQERRPGPRPAVHDGAGIRQHHVRLCAVPGGEGVRTGSPGGRLSSHRGDGQPRVRRLQEVRGMSPPQRSGGEIPIASFLISY